MTNLDDYIEQYSNAHLRRSEGVLEVTLHSDDGPLVWGHGPHEQLGQLFGAIADDPDNKVVLLLGTGGRFIAERPPGQVLGHRTWDSIMTSANRLLTRLMEIPVPIVAAVQGFVPLHAEIALLSDIVIASEDFSFCDRSHFVNGAVPGDGVHVTWPLLMGINRARYFLLTGQTIDARLARKMGIVAEILRSDDIVDRARELASELARQDLAVLRYTRAVLTKKIRDELASSLDYGLAYEGMGVLGSR